MELFFVVGSFNLIGLNMSHNTVEVYAPGLAVTPNGYFNNDVTLVSFTEPYSLWSIDLLSCASATLRSHGVLVVMDQFTRRIIGFGVHAGTVDGAALCRMFNRAIRGQYGLPKHLSSDNDPLYRFHQWQANLRVLEVREIKTIPYVPLSHPFVERLIGTVRREYLDHMLFWTTADLENKLLQKANAGYARVPTSRQSPFVSMATALSIVISDTHGCVIPKTRARCGIRSTSAKLPRNQYSRRASWIRSSHCHRMGSECERSSLSQPDYP